MSESLRAVANRFENWIKYEAVPLWLERGIEPHAGAHYERLHSSGAADTECNTRVRVQARQAFFYAAAYSRGWCEQGKALAQRILAFADAHATHPGGQGYTHLLNKDFDVIDNKQDLYDHAFFLLAFAWCYRITQDKAYIQKAEQLMAHLDSQFGSPHGGWVEGDYPHEQRRQNPHMHLLESFLALYDATQHEYWLTRADEVIALFKAHFFDAEQGVLLEFFQSDWRRIPDLAGRLAEPGHMMEWVWLLDWYGQRRGQVMTAYNDVLYARALELGLAPSGLLFSAVTGTGEIVDRNKRCWGMTEFIKASLVQIRAGNPVAEAHAVKAVNDLFTYFLCASTPGSYIDQRGPQDEVVVDFAPASTLYHLIVAAMELVDQANK